jgi:hypothetical protein
VGLAAQETTVAAIPTQLAAPAKLVAVSIVLQTMFAAFGINCARLLPAKIAWQFAGTVLSRLTLLKQTLGVSQGIFAPVVLFVPNRNGVVNVDGAVPEASGKAIRAFADLTTAGLKEYGTKTISTAAVSLFPVALIATASPLYVDGGLIAAVNHPFASVTP